ncbi:drug resistance transporter, Bcr/CflA subfamily [Geobacter metallireducens RCH3]|uniref:Transporter, Bcr/CflA subfamily n=1 Tax=Geobacter metallireducens (strain ATCC 53774 / DSM 7210 / GS-15) TaxID=269799 RepID=Q39V11_GEOMG|nr:multidrug effflux MFS transporter [Geobacter metallireducens]ABB31913.1 transporter, Bcr/CflA subfamily [Geobacter metallireducens GS-15]EHP89203.1 drug resistance transporter, Bcr/CflA subfamily [Geobacter metallireducens RCH3]
MEMTAAPAIQPADMTRRQLARLVLILGALTAFSSMSIDMYLPAFPQIARDLAAPLGMVQLSISAFLFGSAAGQLFYGPMADRWGRRTPLLLGLTLYVAAAFGCAFVHTGEGLLFWRVVMAVGGGAGMVISRAVVRDLYDTAEAARMFSLLMLVMGAAPILAPIVGGQLLLITGWRGIFGFLAIFGLLSLAAAAMFLPESLPAERRSRRGVVEMGTIYAHLLRNNRYLRYAIALGCVAGVNFSYISGAPFVFIELHGVTPQHFGLFFGANACGLIGASQVNRRLLRRFSAQRILGTAATVNAVGALLLAVAGFTGIGGFPVQVALLFVCLCTSGFLYPNVTALAMAPFDKAAGSASALLGTIQYTLGATAGALVGMFHNGTAVPMTATMALCGVLGWCAIVGVARASSARRAPAP